MPISINVRFFLFKDTKNMDGFQKLKTIKSLELVQVVLYFELKVLLKEVT
jgi:hypothetical protein